MTEQTGARIALAVDPELVKRGLETSIGYFERYKKTTEDSMAAWGRSMDRLLAPTSAGWDVAGSKLTVLAQKVKDIGDVSKLSDDQVAKLGRQIENLSRYTQVSDPALKGITDRLAKLKEAAKIDSIVGSSSKSAVADAAQKQMDLLAAAVGKMGGQSEIAKSKLEGLKAQIRGLVADGAQVPAALAGMENGLHKSTLVLEALGERGFAGAAQQAALLSPKVAGLVAPLTAAAGAVAVVGGSVGALAGKFTSTGGQLADLSARLAIPTNAIQVLAYAAEQSGIEFGTVTTSIEKMQVAMGKSPEKFSALGLSVSELLKLSPDKQFEAVAEAIRAIENPTLQAQAAMALFGESGAKLLPLIRAGVSDLAAEAERLGFVMSQEQVAAADRLDDSLNSLGKSWDGLLVNMGSAIASAPELAGAFSGLAVVLGRVSGSIADMGPRLGAAFSLMAKFSPMTRSLTESVRLLSQESVQTASSRASADSASAGARANVVLANALGQNLTATGGAALNKLLADILKQQAEAQKKAEEAAKRSAENIANYMTSWTKGNPEALRSLDELSKAWSKLSPEQQKNAEVVRQVVADYEKLRGQVSYSALPTELEALRTSLALTTTDFERFYESLGRMSAEASQAAESLGQVLARGLEVPNRDRTGDDEAEIKRAETLIRLGKERGDTEAEIRAALERQGHSTKAIDAAYSKINKQAADTNKATGTWAQQLQNIANQLSAMGSAGGLMGKLLGGVGGIGALFEKGKDGGPGGLLSGIFGKDGKGIGSLFSGGFANVAKNMSGVLAAGMAAFDIGKTIVGLFKKTEAQKAIEDGARDFGFRFSKALAEKIGEDSKRLGDRVAASLKNLKGIIDEAGGIAGFGFDKATAKARDLFSMIQTGKLSVKEAGESFNAVFGDLAEHLEKTKGLASAQFLELMKLDAQYGTQSQAVKDYLGRRVDALQGNLDTLLQGGISTQAGATAIGASLAAAFNQAIQSGASGFDAIKDLLPQIEAFEAQLAEMGLSGGAAFEQLRGMAALAGDEVAGPLIEKFRAAAGAMTELHNMGLLNQETFAGFAAEAGAAYEKLREEGKAGSDAMRLLQPDLQRIWELKKKNNFEVDEATAKLLAEAEAAGLVGEAHMSAEERSATALERMASTLDKLAEKWGIVTQRVEEFSDTVGNIPNPGGGPGGGHGGGWVPPPAPDYPGFASGGAADFGRESVALLHGREAVIPADRSSGIARDVAAQITALMDTGLGREIRGLRDDMRAQQQLLPRAIRDAILLGGA